MMEPLPFYPRVCSRPTLTRANSPSLIPSFLPAAPTGLAAAALGVPGLGIQVQDIFQEWGGVRVMLE